MTVHALPRTDNSNIWLRLLQVVEVCKAGSQSVSNTTFSLVKMSITPGCTYSFVVISVANDVNSTDSNPASFTFGMSTKITNSL